MFKPSENFAANAESGSEPHVPEFFPEQRRVLLAIAHLAIASRLAGKPLPDWQASKTGSPDLWTKLEAPRGVFTTLHLHGSLRGCVGYVAAIRPLFQAVAETACAAAFEDSRFRPVTAQEAPHLKISLSVLSPLFPIRAEQVVIGRHGLVISDGIRRGLLLPQVPEEHGWDRETFLEQTCHKAGLPADAWKGKSATIEGFVAEVFGDDELA
jgi:AmmeMemoRadiSam system protein A